MENRIKRRLLNIVSYFPRKTSSLYLVGGAVRDMLLGLEPKDLDFSCEGITFEELQRALMESVVSVKTLPVGKNAPVVMAEIQYEDKSYELEFAICRVESSTGPGYNDFKFVTEGVTLLDDQRRRDYTINSMALKIDDRIYEENFLDHIIDPFGGREDLLEGCVLRHTSEAFVEDPLRVLRGVTRLIKCPFLDIDKETLKLCWSIDLSAISRDRVAKEFSNAILADKDGRFLYLLKQFKIFKYFWKEIGLFEKVEQDFLHHPEGNLWVHTNMVYSNACKFEHPDPKVVLAFKLSAIFHDIGKIPTSRLEWDEFGTPRVKSPGHASEGVVLATEVLTASGFKNLPESSLLLKRIQFFIGIHMIHIEKDLRRSTLVRLYKQLDELGLNPDILNEFLLCDLNGRGGAVPFRKWRFHYQLLDISREPSVLKPIVNGVVLLSFGVASGPKMGELLKYFVELQDSGELTSENYMDLVVKKTKQDWR